MLRWLVVLLVACDAGTPPKPAPQPVPPPTTVTAKPPIAVPIADAAVETTLRGRHKHGFLTVDLAKPDLGNITLPKHGVVLKTWGLGGDSTLILDSDAGTIRELANLNGKPPTDHRRMVTPSVMTRAMAAANGAWDEDPNGEMPRATDVREDLYVLDGDEAFYVSGYPIGADGTKGRPAAARALELLFAIAPNR